MRPPLSPLILTTKKWEYRTAKCSPATWAYFCSRLEERHQHLRMRVAELNRKLRSRAFRNEFLRKARKKGVS